MKHYLLITPWCPYPPHKNGGVHTTYNIITHKPNEVIIDLLYYYESRNIENERHLNDYIHEFFYYPAYHKPSRLNRISNYIKRRPDMLCGLEIKGILKDITKIKYDVIILDQIFSIEFIRFLSKNSSIVSMMHDNQAMLYKSKSHVDKLWIKQIYDKKQCEFFWRYENEWLNYCSKIIYVSNVDKLYAQKSYISIQDRFDYISLGVDMPDEKRISTPSKNTLVFSGVMDYGPNEDSAVFFATEILPKLNKLGKEYIFTIAGKNPTQKIIDMKSDTIKVTGFVDDMTKTITQSGIYVSPLRFGSGTKNKVLEAMAAGMPVLLSKVSREGIDGLIDGENCIFIDDDSEWVDKILVLEKNENLKKTIGKNAREYVKRYHSWNDVFDHFLL